MANMICTDLLLNWNDVIGYTVVFAEIASEMNDLSVFTYYLS